MLVSWNWLKDYVQLDMPPQEVEQRLMMAGLNHESTAPVGDDLCIDLEVTSNRPDCLGHLGVAREVAVLFQQQLKLPAAQVAEGKSPVKDQTSVELNCPELCPRYTARVIRGVKIASSPAWLARRLTTIGVGLVNNVVDITNYVLMESGQPLHAFDLAKLHGGRIVVRPARDKEAFTAIDHRQYTLDANMCVIADAERAVALGGVMGGADTEVSDRTTDLLIEAAEFDPVSIRNTVRKLNLPSPSSYRFERGVDPEGVDWASRRTCELILEIAGGELAAGVIDVGRAPPPREPVALRLAQLERILGITVPADEVRRILSALGCAEQAADKATVTTLAPSWRRDLTREIDLVEEVARIHGYDKIPEDAGVPMVPSYRSDEDRVLSIARSALTGAGLDEAYTPSMVGEQASAAFSPWSDAEPLVSATPLLRGADRLRRSVVPSLLEALRINQSLSNAGVELFEIAKAYLPQPQGLPREEKVIAIASEAGFERVKGVVELLVETITRDRRLEVADAPQGLFAAGRGCELRQQGRLLGYLGEVSAAGLKQCGLRSGATVAELRVADLLASAQLVPQYQEQSPYPSISQDLNLVVAESVRWADIEATARSAGGEHLADVEYRETYRNAEKDGAGRKRLLLSITLRSAERTLTGEEAEAIRDAIVAACGKQHQAELLAS